MPNLKQLSRERCEGKKVYFIVKNEVGKGTKEDCCIITDKDFVDK